MRRSRRTRTGTTNRASPRPATASLDQRLEIYESSAIWEADALTGRNYVKRTSGLGDAEPVVSPDGRWIAFSANCGDSRCNEYRIYRVGRNGTDPQRLTREGRTRP